MIELGVPFSDPLADGPVVQAAGNAALKAGTTTPRRARGGRGLAERVPVIVMTYANLVLARGAERFADDLAANGLAGLIVPDLPLEESEDLRAACDAAGRRARAARGADDAPRAPGAHRRRRPRLRLHGLGHRHDRRARRDGRRPRGHARRGQGDDGRAGRARLRHHDTASRPRARPTPGAEGVIVGSRLVRAAAEADDPAAAVGPIVEELAAALR